MAVVLIVEDEKLLRWALSEQLRRAGHEVDAAANLDEAGRYLSQRQPDVVLLDLSLPDGNGLDFYQRSQSQLEHSVVVVMTAAGQVEDAVRAMKLGALDFLTKPVDQDELVKLVQRSIAVRGEQLELQAARESRERDISRTIIAEAPAFRELLYVVEQVAQSEVDTILLQGESGSGKNVLARHIHALSSRRLKPFLEVSCAAIPDNLLESELLGHERGAFTDAKATRRGAFELANGGTLVLDEVGELKPELQGKLLHVLEERRLRRVGGSREIAVDVRVIALTNRDLTLMVQQGTFRQDLFYRLNVFPLEAPPLRERPEDILPLAKHFLSTLQAKLGRRFEGFSRQAENKLLGYAWPGNIRELRNVIERAVVIERESRLGPAALILDSAIPSPEPGLADAGSAIAPLETLEREMVQRAMRATGGNQTRAAELLGITRDQLRYRLKKHDLADSTAV